MPNRTPKTFKIPPKRLPTSESRLSTSAHNLGGMYVSLSKSCSRFSHACHRHHKCIRQQFLSNDLVLYCSRSTKNNADASTSIISQIQLWADLCHFLAYSPCLILTPPWILICCLSDSNVTHLNATWSISCPSNAIIVTIHIVPNIITPRLMLARSLIHQNITG